MTTVAVASETGALLGESATFCIQGTDDHANPYMCPEDRDDTGAPIPGQRTFAPVTDATPLGLHVRLVFSELLDPNIEDLKQEDRDGDGKPDVTPAGDPIYYGHIDQTKPVILKCGGTDVAYDGFYDPAGNDLSYPPGPGLVVVPTDFVATGTQDCTIQLNDVAKDKDGNAVPDGSDGGKGPYSFGLATLAVVGTVPADMETGDCPILNLGCGGIEIQFNAPIDLASVGGNITVQTAAGANVPGSFSYLTDPVSGDVLDDTVVEFTPDADLAENTDYVVTISTGITDTAGGALGADGWRNAACTPSDDMTTCSFGFTTDANDAASCPADCGA